jgi:hypothetical protein
MSRKSFCIGLILSLSQLTSAGILTEKKVGDIKNLRGSYSSLIVKYNSQGSKTYEYFTEQSKKGSTEDRCVDSSKKYLCPGLSLHTSTKSETRVSSAKLILDPYGLEKQRKLTRNAVAYSQKDRRYYALGYVNYGSPQTGYLFRSLNSNPESGWESMGPMKVKGAIIPGGYSGTNLLVNDDYGGAPVNHTEPMKNKFVHYTQLAANFQLMYSNDGQEWNIYKKPDGSKNLIPSNFNDDKWNFASVIKIPQGYLMVVSIGWNPIRIHRVLLSKDGLDWSKQVSTEDGDRGKKPGPKNFSLSYDPKSDTVYVMKTKSASKHEKTLYTFKAAAKIPAN